MGEIKGTPHPHQKDTFFDRDREACRHVHGVLCFESDCCLSVRSSHQHIDDPAKISGEWGSVPLKAVVFPIAESHCVN